MLRNGLYELCYRPRGDGGEALSYGGLAVVRDGTILGSDRFGGVFTGRYEFDLTERANRVMVRLSLPPFGELVTGQRIGANGAAIDVEGVVGDVETVSRTTVEIEGELVDVDVTFIGSLPD